MKNFLPSKVYDIIKWVSITAFPVVVTFLNTVLPAAGVSSDTTSMVVTIVGACGVLIAGLISVSSATYTEEK